MKKKKRSNLIEFSPDRLKYALENAGISQKKLAEIYAEKVSISTASAEVELSRSKKQRLISPALLDQIAEIVDVDPDYLTGETNIAYSDLSENEIEYLESYLFSASTHVDPEGFLIPSYSFAHYISKTKDFNSAVLALVSLRISEFTGKQKEDIYKNIKSEDISSLVYDIKKLIDKWINE